MSHCPSGRELGTIKKLQTISLYNVLVETFQSMGLLGSHRVIALYNVSLINIAMTLSFWCKVKFYYCVYMCCHTVE